MLGCFPSSTESPRLSWDVLSESRTCAASAPPLWISSQFVRNSRERRRRGDGTEANSRPLPWMVLHEAILRRNPAEFQAILNSLTPVQRSSVSQYAEVRGRTLLLVASACGCSEAVQLLLAAGASASRMHPGQPEGTNLHAAVKAALVLPGMRTDTTPAFRSSATADALGPGTARSSIHATSTSSTGTMASSGGSSSGSTGTIASSGGSSSGRRSLMEQHRRSEGNLKKEFETTIELLLVSGADPFLEDQSGQHCLDILTHSSPGLLSSLLGSLRSAWSSQASRPCSSETHSTSTAAASPQSLVPHRPRMLWQMESRAPFSGMLGIQISPFSSRDWALMWVTLVPRRYSQPFGSTPKARSLELWVYPSQDAWRPLFCVELDGCIIDNESSDKAMLLLLPSGNAHVKFHNSFMRTCMDAGQKHWLLRMRAMDHDEGSILSFRTFLRGCSSTVSNATGDGVRRLPRGLRDTLVSEHAAAPGSSLARAHHGRLESLSHGGRLYQGGERMVLPIAFALAVQQPLCLRLTGPALHEVTRLLQQVEAAERRWSQRASADNAAQAEQLAAASSTLHCHCPRTVTRDGPLLGFPAGSTEAAGELGSSNQDWEDWEAGGAAKTDAPESEQVSGGPCCVVCLCAPATLGFRHGTTVHHCVCASCASAVIRCAAAAAEQRGAGAGEVSAPHAVTDSDLQHRYQIWSPGSDVDSQGAGAIPEEETERREHTNSPPRHSGPRPSSSNVIVSCPLCRQAVEDVLAMF